MTSGFLPRAVVRKGPLACLAPPNRGGLNSIHIHGTSVPVEEPSTASESGHMHRSKRSARVQCLIRSLRRRALAITNWGCKSSIRNQLQGYSMEELVFERQAAAEYDRAFAHVTRYFMPFVLRAARIVRGMRVLDIAAGTG